MRPATEFELGGKTYRVNPMNAMTQQHVARRVQPIFVAAIPAVLAAIPGGEIKAGALLNLKMADVVGALGDPSEMLARMPDEQFDYIQSRCFACVEMQKPGGAGWAPIWSAGAGRLMFEDIEGHELMMITIQVLFIELGPFLQGLVSKFAAARQS